MRVSMYLGLSVDGFVARADDSLDFLGSPEDQGRPPEPMEEGELGFSAFLATVDAMVMGRRTWDVVRVMDGWFYGRTPIHVLTHRPLELPDVEEAVVSPIAGTPEAVLAQLAHQGAGHVYVDGAMTTQAFLAAGVITDLILTSVPVLIGDGIRLWGRLPGDLRLELVSSQVLRGAAVQTHYRVGLRETRGGEG